MDPILQKNIDSLLEDLRQTGHDTSDPVTKLMLAALSHQVQKIIDEINRLPRKVVKRLCATYIPANKVKAFPALCMVLPTVKSKKGMEIHPLADDASFTFKLDNKKNLTYLPLFRNNLLPLDGIHVLKNREFIFNGEKIDLNFSREGRVWLGLQLPAEVDTLENVSFYIKGTSGVLPEKILIGNEETRLSFVTADKLSEVPMMEPFDSQQMSNESAEMMRNWQNILSPGETGTLLYINDRLRDRDVFKFKGFPKVFQQLMEEKELEKLENTPMLWILFDFGQSYKVPADIKIIPNVMPVVNVNISTVTLTSSNPVAKLTKEEGSYFLGLVETSLQTKKQGFSEISEEVIVRDFDAEVYNPEELYRDIRTLYNRFIEDYHAFVDYHALKDGELLRNMREVVNRISKSLPDVTARKDKFDEGVYVMRSISLAGQPVPVKVSYLTTSGKLGNTPKRGDIMENKKAASLERNVKVVENSEGGTDKATPDQEYELLRYYTLTADRLFTKMDIDAFLRLQLLKEFGKEEIKRIAHSISIEGAGGATKLVRGLYIDISFRDKKNYHKALDISLDKKLHTMITERSCIAMPIIITLIDSSKD